MIDWHSHVLPHMDDGSRDTAESLSMLKMLSEQGVETVIATPHFGANDDTVSSFLERRKASFEELSPSLTAEYPEILLGAEVRYYPGISRMADIEKLSIEGSRLLLVEMSMSKWTEYTVRELVELTGSGVFTVVLAHIERYMKLQNSKIMDRLYESGILMQVNASFFNEFGTRHKALNLLRDGGIHFIGSDCHNLASRPPKLGKTFEVISKKFGNEYLNQINEYGRSMLTQKK